MHREIRQDLKDRFEDAESKNVCVTPLSRSDARRLAFAAERGDILVVHRRVYARKEYWQSLKRSQQAMHIITTLAKTHPSWVFCHYSSALVHGLATSYKLLSDVHIATSSRAHSRSKPGLARHVLADSSTEVVQDITVSSIEQTIFDCLRSCDLCNGLAIVDSALQQKKTTIEALINHFESINKRVSGREHALKTLSHADGRAESGGESIARGRMIELGYMVPDLQHEIVDPIQKGSTYRADFWWELDDKTIVIGELDGHEKYLNPEMTDGKSIVDVMTDERLRESRISATGAKIMRFSFGDLKNTPLFVHLLDSFGIPRNPAAALIDVPAVSQEAARLFDEYRRKRAELDKRYRQAVIASSKICA